MKKQNQMYDFCDTWNPLAGDCQHSCSYCYRNAWKKRFKTMRDKYSGEPRLDEKAIKKNLGSGNFWFVCSMTDLFTENVPDEMIKYILTFCKLYPHNTFFFQSKNPANMCYHYSEMPKGAVVCTTLETNRQFLLNKYSGGAKYIKRVEAISGLPNRMITIEPIIDYDLDIFIKHLKFINPVQINIGSDSSNNNLPEPSKEKILELISELETFTVVYQKKNLRRLLK